ncbi:MAG: FtsQ-type POTRA domain-containing protein [Gammaproteobacteria bacterium]|nr:FtsQ-type POTRA domain-containing protein [Gammaproteobacteria bacterium]
MSVRRKKANRRKQPPKDYSGVLQRLLRLLRNSVIAATVVVLCWGLVIMLDRPVTRVTIDGSFERVTAAHLEGVVRGFLPAGVLTVDLASMRSTLGTLEWVDRVSIERRWPDELHVTVTEQVPAARWGENGLLNVRGELFVEHARHIPAELPRLSGPDGSEWQVAQRYLAMRDKLLQVGLTLSELQLDARGAWQARLANGIEVRLGREESDRRIGLFVDIVAPMITTRAKKVAYIDMRYSNGFAIGWVDGAPSLRHAGALSDA